MAVKEEVLDLSAGRPIVATTVRSIRRRKSGAWVAEVEIEVTARTPDGRTVICNGPASVRGAQRGKKAHPIGCQCIGCGGR